MTIVLCIGGQDPSGGAGLPADARATAGFGAHCCGITTAVIAQNTRGVQRVMPVPSEMLGAQLDNLLSDVQPQAVKVGMLPNVESVHTVLARLRQLSHLPIVVDTVFAPSAGPSFSDADAVDTIVSELLPLAHLVTPNIHEAELLLKRSIRSETDMSKGACDLQKKVGVSYVLLKGGHLISASDGVVDVLAGTREAIRFAGRRVPGVEVRGTGCMLASAIAAQLGRGTSMEAAVEAARVWLTRQLVEAQTIGQGRRVAVGFLP